MVFTQKTKKEFWALLKKLKAEAVKVESSWDNFYHSTVYTMEDGRQYLYLEDTENGLPYSIKWL